MPAPLDCLVLGYDDDTPRQFARLAADRTGSVEARTFQRNQVTIAGQPQTYLDVLNCLVGESDRWQSRDDRPFYHVGEVSNLASIYLASYLMERGRSARAIGLIAAEEEELIACLEEDRPRVAAITTTFYEDTIQVQGLVNLVRRHSPGTTIVVGGPLVQNLLADLPAAEFERALRSMGADLYVNEPEGEQTLCAIIRAELEGKPVDAIANLFVQTGSGFHFTGASREQNPLDEGAIQWDHFPDDLLGRTVQTRTARSCAYHCSFCDYPIRAGRLSVRSVASVERELDSLWRRGVANVVFVDDTFNVPEERFREICAMLIRRDFGFRWFSYFRCGSVRRADTFDLMARSGCAGVFLGIESGDPAVLRHMDKASTVEQYLRGTEALHQRGIITFASFICGFPGETAESVENTIGFINRAQPSLYRVEPWWYNHRSPIHHKRAEFGLEGRAYDWRHATMTASGACDAIDEIFARVKGPSWCPQQSFSFWALPYLIGKGMTRSQIEEFHRLLHRRLPARTVSGASTGDQPLDELRAFVRGLDLEEPRFTRARKAMSSA